MNKFTILLIEDEKSICDFTSRTLSSHGYRVRCASTGREALSLASSLSSVEDVFQIFFVESDAMVDNAEINVVGVIFHDKLNRLFGMRMKQCIF